jgi:preprotein translocase subunit Sec63
MKSLYVLIGVVTMVAIVYLYLTYKTLEAFSSKPSTNAQKERAIQKARQQVQNSNKAIETLTKSLAQLATRKAEVDTISLPNSKARIDTQQKGH